MLRNNSTFRPEKRKYLDLQQNFNAENYKLIRASLSARPC
jgi:hypothetical protein